MKKILLLLLILSCFLAFSRSDCLAAKEKKVNILLLISEQNIAGPQRAWWASEVDLSTAEARLANMLIVHDYHVLAHSKLKRFLRREKAFRRVNLSNEESIKLAEVSKADYVVLGKAVASSGGNVPYSNMRSCNANVTAKLIRVKDAEIIAYLDAVGSSVHTDVITGGSEALVKAAEDLATKIISVLNKE